eukprot:364434-Chlamydomonas_euryale.AAC.5
MHDTHAAAVMHAWMHAVHAQVRCMLKCGACSHAVHARPYMSSEEKRYGLQPCWSRVHGDLTQ